MTKSPGFYLRAGFGFFTERNIYLSLPTATGYLIPLSSNGSFIDLGIGLTWSAAKSSVFSESARNAESFFSFIPSAGYRHQNDKIFWRINFTPIIRNAEFIPWAGLSVGKRF